MRARVLGAGLVVVVCIALGVPALAQQAPGAGLGGYDTNGTAMAISVQPVFPALLPTGDAPVEGTVALSTGRVRSGGISFGRGAILWPGSAASDPGPLFGQLISPEFGALFPKWPAQAQATQDDGEVTAGAEPFLFMKAIGSADRGFGEVRAADVNVPGLLHVEHVASTVDSVVGTSTVSTLSRVTLHGVSLAGGHVTIETLRSVSRTTSNGSSAASDGDVDIAGMRVGGIEVSVTDDGFSFTGAPEEAGDAPGGDGEPFPGSSPEEQVRDVLESINARITLFEGVGRVVGGQAQHYELGLVFSIDNPLGGQGPIPPGRFDMILGSTSASTLGSPPFSAAVSGDDMSLPDAPGAAPDGVSIGSGPEVGGGTLSSLGELGGGDPAGAGSGSGSLGGALPQGAAYSFDGVPVGLIAVLLLVALVVAFYVRRFLDSFMAAGTGTSAGGGGGT